MNRTPLALETLEDRTAPATYALPWLDPQHLSLSFAADGTPIVGHHSELLSFLDARFPNRDAWQSEFVRAFQTWAHHSNISVGLRTERFTPAAYPFGITGTMQGDARFGDIRVGGHSMSPDTLANAAPPDPILAGTLGGDLFLNTTANINPNNLFPILLHEAGHALGLEHSTNPESVMYAHLNNRTELAASDITSIQRLYGMRGPDQNECTGSTCLGNDVRDRATKIQYSHITPRYTGETPLVMYGDMQSGADVDWFELHTLDDYTREVTFWLRTRGLSPAQLRITVEEWRGDTFLNRWGPARTTDLFGDEVLVTVPQVTWRQGTRYYAIIQSDTAAPFGLGRYALGVTFDQLVNPVYKDRMGDVMMGRYDLLREDADRAIDKIFRVFSIKTDTWP